MAITRPTPLKEPFGFAVDPANIHTIPFDSQIATDPRQTSFADGLTPVTMLAIAAGGLAPYGQDFNGIFKELSEHTRFLGAGGQYRFSSTLATYLGGYDAGTVLQSDDGLNAYVSTINNNTGNFNTNPALIGTDWVAWAGNAILLAAGIIGEVRMIAHTNIPSGWLECSGASLLRASYPELFAAIGTTYGAADGTHFNLPDLRGEFVRGWDHSRGVDSGRAFGSSQLDDFKSHQHEDPYAESGVPFDIVPGSYGSAGSNSTDNDQYRFYTGATGGTETRPRNIALMYIIKYR